MRNANIRLLIILAVLSLIGIVGTQVYWLNRAIEQQDQVFNHNVQAALRNVVESLCEANGKDFPSVNPIERVTGNYFVVRTNDRIDLENLEYLISAEIKKRAISEDFEYGVYDCQNDQMVYAENINLEEGQSKAVFPVLLEDEYYFGVYFPDKAKNLMAGFDLWKFSTAITLVVIIFFGFALFVVLRQKRLSEIQRDFINNVSHELKTPLSTLSLASESLIESEKENKYAQIIQSEVNRLRKNVEDILHSSVIETRSNVTKEPISLGPFLNQLLLDWKKQFSSHMIDWQLKVDAPKAILSNQLLIENALINMVENAAKYGGKNIGISVEQDNKKTTFRISDDGKGIPSEHHSKIFRKFYRVPEEQYQHNEKGFGLGLYIVKSAIEKLGGKINVESIINQGSTFIITIPNG